MDSTRFMLITTKKLQDPLSMKTEKLQTKLREVAVFEQIFILLSNQVRLLAGDNHMTILLTTTIELVFARELSKTPAICEEFSSRIL